MRNKNEIYYIYYGYRDRYVKTESGKAIAIGELTDPLLPWKKKYIEVIFSGGKKYTIHLPAFLGGGKISLNGSDFLNINGATNGYHFYYSTTFENQFIQFKELAAAENYELFVNGQLEGYIHYYPLLAKELLNQRIRTELVVPESVSTIAILFALLQMDNFDTVS